MTNIQTTRQIIVRKNQDPDTLQFRYDIEGINAQSYRFSTAKKAANFVSALPFSFELHFYDEDEVIAFSFYREYEKYTYQLHASEGAKYSNTTAKSFMKYAKFRYYDKKRKKMGEDKYYKVFFENVNKDDTVSIELQKHQILSKIEKISKKEEHKWNKRVAKERMKDETKEFRVDKKRKEIKDEVEDFKFQNSITQLVDDIERTIEKSKNRSLWRTKKTFIKQEIAKKQDGVYFNKINALLLSFLFVIVVSILLVFVLI